MFFTLKHTWKHTLATDATAIDNLRTFGPVTVIIVSITILYAAFGTIFGHLHGTSQTVFTLILPIMKIILKVLFDRALHNFEDIAPILIVFNLDVFHSLFVSLAMQQGPSGNSFGVLVAVDVVHSVIAFYEIRSLARHATALLKSNRPTHVVVASKTDGGRLDLFDEAVRLLESTERIRTHSLISTARHLRIRDQRVAPAPTYARNDGTQVEGVRAVLRLLHVTEFYLVIEYAEVMIAAIYSVYLYGMSILPSRQFYTSLKDYSDQELQAKATLVATFAAVELVTFFALCAVVDYHTRPRWAMRQVAFVLESHLVLVQAVSIFWVSFVINGSLEHFGTDYTFKFEWLRHHGTDKVD